ncbi:hypothetical protein Tco_1359329 [Tanacetum coccineum]
MVYQLTKFHVQRVDMVINPPWNLPFLGAKGLTSPEQTATGKGISNPLMAVMVCQKPYGIQLTNVSSTERVNTPGSDENRLKLYDLMYKIVNVADMKNSCCKDTRRRLEVLQIKNNLKNSIYNILRKLKVPQAFADGLAACFHLAGCFLQWWVVCYGGLFAPVLESTTMVIYERAELTLKRMGIWLFGVCFKTRTICIKCHHGNDLVPPPDNGNGDVRFVLYDLTRPPVPSYSMLDHVDGLLPIELEGFTLSLLDSLFSKGLCTVKSIPPKFRLGFSRVLKGALDKVICKPDDISCWVSLLVLPLCLLKTLCPRSNLECKSANTRQRQEESITSAISSWGVPGGSLQLVRETLAESAPPMLDLDGLDHDLTEQNLKQCKRKICDGYYIAAMRVLSSSGVAPYNDVTLQELKTKHPFMFAPSLPDLHIDHHPLIASQDVVLDKIKSFPRGTSYGYDGLRAQHLMDCLSGAAVAISDELVSSITQVVNLFLEGKCPMMLGEYIASALLTPLVKPGGGICPIVVGTVWRCLVSKFGVRVPGGGEAILHAVNRLVEDHGDDVGLSMLLSFATLALLDCITESTPCGHAKWCSRAWYLDDGTIVGDTLVLLGGPVSVDVDFGSALVMKRVSKTVGLLDAVVKINDPQCELLLIWAYAGVSKLYFAMRTCPPCVFESAQLSFDMPLRSALVRIVTASGPGFGDWQWRLTTLPFAFGGLGTKLLRHVCIVASGPTFDDALCVFNKAMEIDFLSTPSDVAAPKLMKKMADIYFTQHTSDWLRVVPISGLGQTMNGKTYLCVLCYRLGVPLFSVSKPSPAYSKVSTRDVYGDHVVSCAGVIGIKHRYNAVHDTLVDICFLSGISAGKEVEIGLGGGCDKALCHVDMLLYSWEGGLDVCVDLTGSSPLT